MKSDVDMVPRVEMTRRSFVGGVAGVALAGMARSDDRSDRSGEYAEWQRDIDAITPKVYEDFQLAGTTLSDVARSSAYAEYPGLKRYDDAFTRVESDVRAVSVPEGKAAVWYIYNMGVVIKTAQTLFSVDLNHGLAERLVPYLSFALITHNHTDHFSYRFLTAMDRSGKTVVSNFASNYGAHFGKKMPGGYTREPKTFTFGDVTVKTSVSDHNG